MNRIVAATAAVLATLAMTGCQEEVGVPGPTGSTTTSTPPTTSPTSAPDPTTSPTQQAEPSSSSATEVPSSTGSARTYAEAARRIEAASRAGRAEETVAFRTPSGNILCRIEKADNSGGEGCEINEDRPSPSDGKIDCAGGDGGPASIGRVLFVYGIPRPECNSDTVFSNRNLPVLRYGSVATLPQSRVACLSETTGITCVDQDSRYGFVLARGSYSRIN